MEKERSVRLEKKKKVALVLSMGGARGIAHIGVIEELTKRGFEIVSIAGSSMGALVGAMYAAGRLEAFKTWLFSWNLLEMWRLTDFSYGRGGLVKGDRFIEALSKIVPDTRIEDLPLPFVALATDITRGREVVFSKGSLFEAIRASISIPGLFRPVLRGDTVLVDGGILNPLPVGFVARSADDLLVAVDVNASDGKYRGQPTHPYRLLVKASRLMMGQISRYQMAGVRPDLLIELPGDDYEMLEFNHAEKIARWGAEAARKALDRYESGRNGDLSK